jgi:hypothetical protein
MNAYAVAALGGAALFTISKFGGFTRLTYKGAEVSDIAYAAAGAVFGIAVLTIADKLAK